VDGPSVTSERGTKEKVHDERMLLHTQHRHSTPQGLVGWARGCEARAAALPETEIERARGGEKKRTGLMAGRRGSLESTGGTSDDKRRGRLVPVRTERDVMRDRDRDRDLSSQGQPRESHPRDYRIH
jgi:hypothetical protein